MGWPSILGCKCIKIEAGTDQGLGPGIRTRDELPGFYDSGLNIRRNDDTPQSYVGLAVVRRFAAA
jgi:hypothetical protein